MIVTKQIRTLAELQALKLEGIEVIHAATGVSNSDFSSLTLRDTKTGTQLVIGAGSFSNDLRFSATTPPKKETRHRLVEETEDGEWRSKELKDDELPAASSARPSAKVETFEVEIPF